MQKLYVIFAFSQEIQDFKNNRVPAKVGAKNFYIVFHLLGRINTGFVECFHFDFCRMSNNRLDFVG